MNTIQITKYIYSNGRDGSCHVITVDTGDGIIIVIVRVAIVRGWVSSSSLGCDDNAHGGMVTALSLLSLL